MEAQAIDCGGVSMGTGTDRREIPALQAGYLAAVCSEIVRRRGVIVQLAASQDTAGLDWIDLEGAVPLSGRPPF